MTRKSFFAFSVLFFIYFYSYGQKIFNNDVVVLGDSIVMKKSQFDSLVLNYDSKKCLNDSTIDECIKVIRIQNTIGFSNLKDSIYHDFYMLFIKSFKPFVTTKLEFVLMWKPGQFYSPKYNISLENSRDRNSFFYLKKENGSFVPQFYDK